MIKMMQPRAIYNKCTALAALIKTVQPVSCYNSIRLLESA